MEENEVAIFWDYENVRVVEQGKNIPMVEAILHFSESRGYLRIQRVYANWKNTNDIIIQALDSLGFDIIQVSMGKTNSVDIRLAVDCISLAYDIPSLTHVIIVTGDKDYIPIVNG